MLRGDEEMTAKPVGGERGEEVSAQQWRARDEEPDLNALAAGEEAEEDTQAQEHEVKERRRGAKGDSFDTVKTLLDRQSAIDRIEASADLHHKACGRQEGLSSLSRSAIAQMRIRNKFGEEVEGEQHQAPKGLQEVGAWGLWPKLTGKLWHCTAGCGQATQVSLSPLSLGAASPPSPSVSPSMSLLPLPPLSRSLSILPHRSLPPCPSYPSCKPSDSRLGT